MDDKNQYPPSGVLFSNNRKQSDKSPDVNGTLEVDADVLRHLADCHNAGQPMKVDLAGWRKTMKGGGTFYSLVAKVPWQKTKNNAGQTHKESLPDNKWDEDIPF